MAPARLAATPAFSCIPCPPCRPPAKRMTPWPPTIWSSNLSQRTLPSPPQPSAPRLASVGPCARRPGAPWPWPRSPGTHPTHLAACFTPAQQRDTARLTHQKRLVPAGWRHWASSSLVAARPQRRRKAGGKSPCWTAEDPQTLCEALSHTGHSSQG